jgi:hypothetical protein
VTNGENTNDHKLKYFQNSLRGRITDYFGKYETTHLETTWAKVQHDFIAWFNDIKIERQAIVILRYMKQKKYELMEDYYNKFF